MVSSKISGEKIFDIDEAKAIALEHIKFSGYPERFKFMLRQLNSDLDYVFEILKSDIEAGDLKMKEPVHSQEQLGFAAQMR